MVTKIRFSGHREDQLSKLNESFGLNDLKVVLDVKTRWNSTYAMLIRAVHLQQVEISHYSRVYNNVAKSIRYSKRYDSKQVLEVASRNRFK